MEAPSSSQQQLVQAAAEAIAADTPSQSPSAFEWHIGLPAVCKFLQQQRERQQRQWHPSLLSAAEPFPHKHGSGNNDGPLQQQQEQEQEVLVVIGEAAWRNEPFSIFPLLEYCCCNSHDINYSSSAAAADASRQHPSIRKNAFSNTAIVLVREHHVMRVNRANEAVVCLVNTAPKRTTTASTAITTTTATQPLRKRIMQQQKQQEQQDLQQQQQQEQGQKPLSYHAMWTQLCNRALEKKRNVVAHLFHTTATARDALLPLQGDSNASCSTDHARNDNHHHHDDDTQQPPAYAKTAESRSVHQGLESSFYFVPVDTLAAATTMTATLRQQEPNTWTENLSKDTEALPPPGYWHAQEEIVHANGTNTACGGGNGGTPSFPPSGQDNGYDLQQRQRHGDSNDDDDGCEGSYEEQQQQMLRLRQAPNESVSEPYKPETTSTAMNLIGTPYSNNWDLSLADDDYEGPDFVVETTETTSCNTVRTTLQAPSPTQNDWNVTSEHDASVRFTSDGQSSIFPGISYNQDSVDDVESRAGSTTNPLPQQQSRNEAMGINDSNNGAGRCAGQISDREEVEANELAQGDADYAVLVRMEETSKRTTDDRTQQGSTVGPSTEYDAAMDGEELYDDLELTAITAPESDQAVDGDANFSEMENIYLEEELLALEARLENLTKRQQLLDKELTVVRSRRFEGLEKVQELQSRKRKLLDTNAQQLVLLERLKNSLSKSTEKLAKLSSSKAALSIEEIVQLVSDADKEVPTQTIDAVVLPGTPSSLPVSIEDEKLSNSVEEMGSKFVSSMMPGAQQDYEDAQSVEDDDNSMMKDCLGQLRLKGLTRGSNAMDQTPVVSSALLDVGGPMMLDIFWASMKDIDNRLAPFLPCIASKQLLLKILEVSSIEILCLDAKEPTGRHRRQAMWTTCLDGRLLGSCRDVKERVPCPPAQNSSAVLDPNIALCPYELSGMCSDPYCPYQHLLDRPDGKILPREFLPLPNISLPGKPALPPVEERPKKRQRLNSDDHHHTSQAVVEDDPFSIANNSDFVALPDVPPIDESGFKETIENESAELVQSTAIWWETVRLPNPNGTTEGPIPVLSLFQSLGLDVSTISGTLTLVPEVLPLSLVDGCRFVGRLVDGCRTAVHAGRFDIVHAIGQLLQNDSDSWTAQDEYNAVNTFVEIVKFGDRWLQETSRSCFNYDSVQGITCFANAFDAQAEMGIVSIYFCELHRLLAMNAIDETDLAAWLETASSLFGDSSSTNSSASLNETDSVESRAIRSSVHNLVKGFRSNEIRTKIQSDISSIRSLIDELIEPTWFTVRELVQSNNERKELLLLRACINVGAVVLGALEFSGGMISDPLTDLSYNKNEFVELYTAIDRLLMSFHRLVSRSPWVELLLAPLFAANISLACTMQLYVKANNRLGALLLSPDDDCVFGGLRLMCYSELLWSQLIQLRASLPLYEPPATDDEKIGKSSSIVKLSKEISTGHHLMADRVSRLQIWLNHLVLDNDWNLVREVNSESLDEPSTNQFRNQCHDIVERLYTPSAHGITNKGARFRVEGKQLLLRNRYEDPSLFKSSIPHSLLLAGSFLTSLVLRSCGLQQLPFNFGSFFAKLKNIDLSCNELEGLPASVVRLTALEVFRVDSNRIASLPANLVLPKLTHLSAANNLLTCLPLNFECRQLEDLNFEGNPVKAVFWTQVALLPKLRELKPAP